MKNILLVFGTRPEAIKMCPVLQALRRDPDRFRTAVCVTGQHRRLLDGALSAFGVVPDYDLDLLREEQSLFHITRGVLDGLPPVLEKERPDLVLVHGDTTTAFAAALACYYTRIPVGHVEAGLRTYDPMAPWPEEFNRRAVDGVSRFCFAPTEVCRDNLLREGIRPERIFVTGNTVIDALHTTVRRDFTHPALDWAKDSRLLLVTVHRRESLGEPMRRIFRALRRITEAHPEVKAVYPVHPNPAVRAIAEEELAGCGRVRLIEPLDVPEFHNLLARSFLVLTDSGGIQEEAPALGVPALVAREATERPEGIGTGALRLTGTGEAEIFAACHELLTDPAAYQAMARAGSPYGDGSAARRIADILRDEL